MCRRNTRLTNNNQDDIECVDMSIDQVVQQCLWCSVDHALRSPLSSMLIICKRTSGRMDVPHQCAWPWQHYLSTQWLRCPECHMSCDKRRSAEQREVSWGQRTRLCPAGTNCRLPVVFSKGDTCGDTNHSQLSITTPAMKVFPSPVGSATRVFSTRQFLTMLY